MLGWENAGAAHPRNRATSQRIAVLFLAIAPPVETGREWPVGGLRLAQTRAARIDPGWLVGRVVALTVFHARPSLYH